MSNNTLVVNDFEQAVDILEQLQKAISPDLESMNLPANEENSEESSEENTASEENTEGTIDTSHGGLPLLLRWPKGKKLKISKTLQSQDMQLAVTKKREWFDMSGNLQVDNEQVIELRRLLELLKTSNGRYVKLDDDQILALSENLHNQLQLLSQSLDDGEFHPLASLQVEEAVSGMRMKTIHGTRKLKRCMSQTK
jgi:hypothetical protein